MLIAAPYRVPHPSNATSGGESPGVPASPSYDGPSQLQCFPHPPASQTYQYTDGIVPAHGSIGTPRAAGDEAGAYTCSPGGAALGAARGTGPASSPSPGAISASTRHPPLTSSRPGKRPRIAPSTLAGGVTAAPGSRDVPSAGRSASPGPAYPADPKAAGKAWAALLSAAADEATAATDAPPLVPASAGGEDSSEDVDGDASPGDGGALGAAQPAPAAVAAGVPAGSLAEAAAPGSDRNREREQQHQLRQQFQQLQQLQQLQHLQIYQQHQLAQLAHAQRIHQVQVATMSLPHTARAPEPTTGCAATTASQFSPPPPQRQSQRPAVPAPHGKGPAMVTVAQVMASANAATTRAAAFVGTRISACRSQQQLLDLCGRAAVIVKAALGAGLQTLLPASTNDAASMSHSWPVLERALLQLPEAVAQQGVNAQMAAAIALTIHRQLLGPNRRYRRAGRPTPSHLPVEQA